MSTVFQAKKKYYYFFLPFVFTLSSIFEIGLKRSIRFGFNGYIMYTQKHTHPQSEFDMFDLWNEKNHINKMRKLISFVNWFLFSPFSGVQWSSEYTFMWQQIWPKNCKSIKSKNGFCVHQTSALCIIFKLIGLVSIGCCRSFSVFTFSSFYYCTFEWCASTKFVQSDRKIIIFIVYRLSFTSFQ